MDNIKYYSHFIGAYERVLEWMYQEQLEEYEKIGININSLKVVEKEKI